jgi:putative transposase
VYLAAIMDWYSRYVLTWRLSNRLEGSFCLEALDAALKKRKPEIFNTDQGAQFTSLEFTSRLLDRAVAVSMDGRGRALDNVFIERLWRSLKYEDIYLKDYGTVDELYEGLTRYFDTYNHERFHQALDYRTPYQVYHGRRETNSGSGGRVRVKRVGKKSAA